jgi:hypothetical protein
VLWALRATSQATWSSNSVVNLAPCRAQGTAVTTTPCSGQLTLGLSASSQVTVLPRSRARHRRGPSPRSNPGQRLRHNPQRSRSRQPSRTVTTAEDQLHLELPQEPPHLGQLAPSGQLLLQTGLLLAGGPHKDPVPV